MHEGAVYKSQWKNYFFVLPAVLLFIIFYLYPTIEVFRLSVLEWDGISSEKKLVWFEHFIKIFRADDLHWWRSLFNAGGITFLALIFQNALALILALIVSKGIRGANAYKVIFYIPPILSGIVVGLIWNWLYEPNFGILKALLSTLHLDILIPENGWLGNPNTALVSVAIIHMWRGFGWGFIILLAGLQNIPQELYEAAEVDGAGAWHQFIYITFPLMLPVFFLVSILTILGTMQIFDLIVATTNGGPQFYTEVPVTRMLFAIVQLNRFGYACTMGIVFGAILLTVSMIQLYLNRKFRRW